MKLNAMIFQSSSRRKQFFSFFHQILKWAGEKVKPHRRWFFFAKHSFIWFSYNKKGNNFLLSRSPRITNFYSKSQYNMKCISRVSVDAKAFIMVFFYIFKELYNICDLMAEQLNFFLSSCFSGGKGCSLLAACWITWNCFGWFCVLFFWSFRKKIIL